ncbi:hypothetical protein [uncultured Litoreibacter sp.]|uniref:hypothetical protein n=1 Tax=uncultured Litoreibacter sp. TaxID=1392394 RepID=UPI00261BCE70|nr:hypothetical protein [uncultured Litoreibacter sp.]
MFRIALAGLCLVTAAPVFAGDQSLYPHVHTNTFIVGSYTTPINYRAHNPSGDNTGRGFNESEIIRSRGHNTADTKYLPRTRHGAGSIADDGPVTEIFVENLPALNGTHAPRRVMLGSNLPRY